MRSAAAAACERAPPFRLLNEPAPSDSSSGSTIRSVRPLSDRRVFGARRSKEPALLVALLGRRQSKLPALLGALLGAICGPVSTRPLHRSSAARSSSIEQMTPKTLAEMMMPVMLNCTAATAGGDGGGSWPLPSSAAIL